MDQVKQNGEMRYVNVLDYLVVIARHKKLVVRFTGITIFLSAILLFLVLPRWYKSTSVVMPPRQKNALGLLNSISRAAAPLRNLGRSEERRVGKECRSGGTATQ